MNLSPILPRTLKNLRIVFAVSIGAVLPFMKNKTNESETPTSSLGRGSLNPKFPPPRKALEAISVEDAIKNGDAWQKTEEQKLSARLSRLGKEQSKQV